MLVKINCQPYRNLQKMDHLMVNYTLKLLKTEKPPALSLQDKDESEFFSLGSSEFFKKKFINRYVAMLL